MTGYRRHRGAALLIAAGLGVVAYKAVQRWREADLRHQVVLITGGSRGLGLALARAFARERCRIVLCARDAQALQQAREDLVQRGANALAIPCDVADREQVRDLVAQATRHFGRIDILVNNAGTIQVGPLSTTTVEDFEAALNVMFWGMLYPTLEVLPQMRQRRQGRIVNITSIGGMVSVPHLLPYTCAKFAAVGFSEGLRAELRREGLTVTTIVPGLMRTGSYLHAIFRGQQAREYTWFALGSSLPFVSMSAERAARQIVQATKRGQAQRILSLPANVLERFHGLCPGTTANVLGLVNRFLPQADTGKTAPDRQGMEVQQLAPSRLRDAFTGLGRAAARRFHQVDGRT